mmetsp:Transcript_22195/g.53783  ORF Transcript_22195/g.53783 Transcript_22195/m.53783 type:complete len:213 (+) Transcript_22195:1987-2625(+)
MPPAAIRVVAEQGSEAVDRSQETNTHHDNSFTAGLHAEVGKADLPTNAMRGNINESNSDTIDNSVLNRRTELETETKNQAAHASQLQHSTASTSPADANARSSIVRRAKEVRKMLAHIRDGLSSTESCSNSNESAGKIQALRVDFYSHLKSWLAPRVKMVRESDMKEAQDMMNEFDKNVTELQRSENDEDYILCFSSVCEDLVEGCKNTFPL